MRFDIITIFPELFPPYLTESILGRAQEKKLVQTEIHNLRDFTRDSHKKVDDKPYGGGPGMVLQIEPLTRVLTGIPREKKNLVILFSATGKQFDAKLATQWARKYEQIIMIAGRYEGVDERIKKIAKIQEVSIGPYVLTGGELPALVVMDAVARHIPGVLGDAESLEEKRYGIGVPAYTRPEVFPWKGKKYRVPSVLLSGNHKKIEAWRALQKPRDAVG
ncbi:MAG: tRNA (guanosine(37)-N1)-methyltransferase TrmD [Candidatus Sungbacteria bacterium]|nr:tRNA (guanosine(37)-N1)-methyltransferase TrmD [Candidatus Sungbacteria bacterium]